MPTFSVANMISLMPGDMVQVWVAETPVPGNGGVSASQPLALINRGTEVKGFAVDGQFSAAPGAFEVDVQVANPPTSRLPVDTDFQTINGGNITTVDAVNQTFHLDAPGVIARFVRLLMRSRTNVVSITAGIRKG